MGKETNQGETCRSRDDEWKDTINIIEFSSASIFSVSATYI